MFCISPMFNRHPHLRKHLSTITPPTFHGALKAAIQRAHFWNCQSAHHQCQSWSLLVLPQLKYHQSCSDKDATHKRYKTHTTSISLNDPEHKRKFSLRSGWQPTCFAAPPPSSTSVPLPWTGKLTLLVPLEASLVVKYWRKRGTRNFSSFLLGLIYLPRMNRGKVVFCSHKKSKSSGNLQWNKLASSKMQVHGRTVRSVKLS